MEARDASAVRWHTLEWPAGPKFPPAYEPHEVKLIYDGEPVDLTPDQEEVASFYASLLDVLAPPNLCACRVSRVACACVVCVCGRVCVCRVRVRSCVSRVRSCRVAS